MIKKCPKCGASVLENSTICPNCFQYLKTVNNSTIKTFNKKSKFIAAFLALFFGGIGFHKFYLGKSIEAIFYILFC